MKHPEREEWIPFLCGEAKPADHDRLAAHLDRCEDCRHEVGSWQRTLRRLDAWQVPHDPRPAALATWFQFAAAAVVVLLLGFSIGRLSAHTPTVEQLRSAMEPELRRQITRHLAQQVQNELERASAASLESANNRLDARFTDYIERLDKTRAQDAAAYANVLQNFKAQYAADFLALKKDVDTVAVNADAGLRQAEQQLVHLAGYSRP